MNKEPHGLTVGWRDGSTVARLLTQHEGPGWIPSWCFLSRRSQPLGVNDDKVKYGRHRKGWKTSIRETEKSHFILSMGTSLRWLIKMLLQVFDLRSEKKSGENFVVPLWFDKKTYELNMGECAWLCKRSSAQPNPAGLHYLVSGFATFSQFGIPQVRAHTHTHMHTLPASPKRNKTMKNLDKR